MKVAVISSIFRAMGKTMTSASQQTPRVKRRSDFFGFGKMLGRVGKRMLGPVSFASRGVSERSYLNSPAARRRRSGNNYMAELADYRKVRWVEEENINRGQGDQICKYCVGVYKISHCSQEVGFKNTRLEQEERD